MAQGLLIKYQWRMIMLGIKFIKADPSTYLIKYRNGKIIKEGHGLSFFYHAPSTSLVSVPIGNEEVHFVFNELTKDFQEVTVQGQVAYKINDVYSLTKMLNFTLNDQEEYASEDPKKVAKRVLNAVQVHIKNQFAQLNLKEAIASSEKVTSTVKNDLVKSSSLLAMGLEVNELSIISIKPNQETARALEAETREVILRQADEAIYARRNAAIEQECIIKENELNTEIAVEDKKREILERKLETERSQQEKKQKMSEYALEGNIVLQKKNKELVNLKAENNKKEAESKAYAIEAYLTAIQKTDSKVLQTLAASKMSPAQLIASSFKELAENSSRIGELNISPSLLKQLMDNDHE